MTEENMKKWQKSNEERDVLAYMLDQWRMFALTGDAHAMHRAGRKVFTAFEQNTSSVRLCLAAVFLHIQSGQLDTARNLLNRVNAYKNYYKHNDSNVFLALHFLWTLLELKNDKPKQAFKYYKNMEAPGAPGVDAAPDEGFAAMLRGHAALEMGRPADALALFTESFESGCRSCFLFVSFYQFLKKRHAAGGARTFLLHFMNWALSRNAAEKEAFEHIIDYYEPSMSFVHFEDTEMGVFEKIYAQYPKSWILDGICRRLIARGDDSPEALAFFEQAQQKQILIPYLNTWLVRAAYKHGKEHLSRYCVGAFMSEPGAMSGADAGLKAFLYHIILNDKKFQDLAAEQEKMMLDFAFYCLENRLEGRYVNSLFKFALDKSADTPLPQNYIEIIENTLEPQLFTRELRLENPRVSHVWVVEKEKASARFYEVEGGLVTIEASSDCPAFLFFSQMCMQFVSSGATVKNNIENADAGLYLYFYRKKKRTPALYVALSKYIIISGKFMEESIDILSDTLPVKDLSRGFRMQVSAALGNALYSRNRYDKALAYYTGVDENYLNDQCIEQMLKVFVSVNEIDKAVSLINKKSHCISDRTLFQALKHIAARGRYHPYIADTAYELLLKSWYDKALLDIVLKHYKGSQQEWQALSKTLAAISASQESLDEIIIKNSIRMHQFDVGAQKVFARMFENSPDNEYVGWFIYYAAYEILINDARPEYDTLAIMEKVFYKHEDSLLAYALGTVYLKKSISTLHSDDIISKALVFMEKEDVLLPVFALLKDKKAATAYIMKNLPLIYRCEPDKNVVVYYKIDDEAEYNACEMKYLRFGLYTAKITHFYAEKITYYFSEEMRTGSIVTKEYTAVNNMVYLNDKSDLRPGDPFFTINNALVYEQMFRYERVEAIITDTLAESRAVRGRII